VYVPDEPPLEATMITRTGPREELALVHDGQRTVIEGPVLQIGRAPGCDIVLDDKNVSRRHAEIRRRGPVVVLIDLDSTNGTIVNGRRVREHPLADGDRISLGESRLTFERRTI
jgi:pSer/pThr/pTyr-binding forkhead associated (FHA) protein